MPPRNQRSIITPEHFTVAPGILGLPLASPTRRAYAMAIDGILVLILVKSGAVFLGLAAAFLLFRASRSDPASGFIKKSVRLSLRLSGAALIFVVILNIGGSIRDRLNTPDTSSDAPIASVAAEAQQLNLNLSPGEALKLVPHFIALGRAEDSSRVANAANEVLSAAKRGGMSSQNLYSVRGDLVDMMGDNADPAEVKAVDAALLAVAGPPPDSVETTPIVRSYLAAIERGDTSAVIQYRDSVKQVLAGTEIAALQLRADRLEARADSLHEELEESREARGVRLILAGFADDLGLGFGWAAVYFTAFLALWRGQTPGKRVAGIRVLRLDGKPLGWWISFERFGGYAASFPVGLMGFFQILWDRNRQGLHDKACETVVVRNPPQVRPRA